MFVLTRPEHFAEYQRDPNPEHLLLVYTCVFVKLVIHISHLSFVKRRNPPPVLLSGQPTRYLAIVEPSIVRIRGCNLHFPLVPHKSLLF